MRELSDYEKKRHLPDGRMYDPPEFLAYGDELGEAYDGLAGLLGYSDYIAKEIAEALPAAILDIYYDNLLWIYQEQVYPPEQFNLPPHEWVARFQDRLIARGVAQDQATKMALDWAMLRRGRATGA